MARGCTACIVTCSPRAQCVYDARASRGCILRRNSEKSSADPAEFAGIDGFYGRDGLIDEFGILPPACAAHKFLGTGVRARLRLKGLTKNRFIPVRRVFFLSLSRVCPCYIGGERAHLFLVD